MKKRSFDIIFIFSAAAILIVLNYVGWLEQYMTFSLIPILIAYQLGQFSERKFKTKVPVVDSKKAMSKNEFNTDNLSTKEAFWVMYYFLEEQYKLTNGTMELSDVLSFSQPFEFDKKGHFDGKVTGNRRIAPADSAMMDDWNDAVEKFRTEGPPKPEPLKKNK